MSMYEKYCNCKGVEHTYPLMMMCNCMVAWMLGVKGTPPCELSVCWEEGADYG